MLLVALRAPLSIEEGRKRVSWVGQGRALSSEGRLVARSSSCLRPPAPAAGSLFGDDQNFEFAQRRSFSSGQTSQPASTAQTSRQHEIVHATRTRPSGMCRREGGATLGGRRAERARSAAAALLARGKPVRDCRRRSITDSEASRGKQGWGFSGRRQQTEWSACLLVRIRQNGFAGAAFGPVRRRDLLKPAR